ncbi:MAG: DUF4469 domain-containing protein [Tannerellaceae bacterium]|nr:DUF4469 domain-containing protein [Tannerellaceae bacterium]
MNKRFLWKVWLRLNHLTHVINDYVAEVSKTGKTLSNADIARLFGTSGSELSVETILDILDRADRIRREKIQEGYSIQTGICHLSPRVLGNWLGASTAYDPASHKVTLDIVTTAEMRAALSEVGIEVLGIRDGGAYIGLVTDVATGATDGTVTRNGQIIIAGDKIKIEPDTNDTSIGVFLAGEDTTYRLAPLAVNRPKEIIGVMPDVPAGTYTLYILTRFAGSNVSLKEPRHITYSMPLIVS